MAALAARLPIMAESLSAAVAFGPEQMTLSTELLRALTAGDNVLLVKLLGREGRPASHVTIDVNGAGASPAPGAVSPPRVATSCRLLGVASNGNIALHLLASRGHAELAAFICEEAPSLVATRNNCLDTPLHCEARAGHRELAECLLATMRAGGTEEAEALRARNFQGATALYEAVRHGRAGVVDLFMAVLPELASVTNADGVSALYCAAMSGSLRIVRMLLRPSPDGSPSPASFSGREGRKALHVAASSSIEIVQELLAWELEGSNLLTRVDSSGRTALHLAVLYDEVAAVELLLDVEASLARISDEDGLFPLHAAAMSGSTGIIDVIINKIPECYEIVDGEGRNILHCAVQHNQKRVIRHICRNDKLASLLNATDAEGNTPLHLTVRYGHPRTVSLLLQTMSVETGIVNKDGMTAAVCRSCLQSGGAWSKLFSKSAHDNMLQLKELKRHDSSSKTIASVLIASATFAAASAVLAAYHPDPGATTPAERFALRAFIVSDTIAFVCSIVATCFLIYSEIKSITLSQRECYHLLASGLVPMGSQFMIGAFAFSVDVVLGGGHRWLTSFVYVICVPTVLFCFPGIWVPLHFGIGKAIWRRGGWTGLANVYQRPSSVQELIYCLGGSFLFTNLRKAFFVILISVSFVVSITLSFAFPSH